MDIVLARTFLEVNAAGSFVAAAETLNLTQTAISARIRTLEEQLGAQLFIRNKAGARLTPAGERFQRDAMVLVQVWERARQRVGLPSGRTDIVGIGCELSLWSPLLSNWLVWMRDECPEIGLNATVAPAAHLLERVQEGSLDVAILYNPPTQYGLAAELLSEEKLVLVSTLKTNTIDPERYVHVDWGTAFDANLQTSYPILAKPAVSISLGPLALSYLLSRGGLGYFRQSVVAPYVSEGHLRLIGGAPAFSYSVHAVYSAQCNECVLDKARTGLRLCASQPVPRPGRRHRKPSH